MIEEQILERHRARLEKELEDLRIQLELEKIKFIEDLNKKREGILRDYEKEILEQNENALRALKNQLERDINLRKREFLERQIQELLEYMNQKYLNELREIISKLEYDHIIVPDNLKIQGADRSKELKFGFLYRPRGKTYYINMDMRRIIEKYIHNIVDQI